MTDDHVRRDLRRELGADAPDAASSAHLRVAVVTPYHREPDALLQACHASVLAQSHPATHIVVADGHPSPIVQGWDAQHIALPREHANYGGTPRAIGALSAIAQGFDAITFLDADNWYDPDHLRSMIDLHVVSGAAVCVASRTLRRLDGSLLDVNGEAEDGKSHVDTNCLFFTAAAFRILPVWGLIPRVLRPIDDRVMWAAIRSSGLRIARRVAPTVHYRTSFRVHYEERGEAPPPGAKGHEHVRTALQIWNDMPPRERELVGRRLWARF